MKFHSRLGQNLLYSGPTFQWDFLYLLIPVLNMGPAELPNYTKLHCTESDINYLSRSGLIFIRLAAILQGFQAQHLHPQLDSTGSYKRPNLALSTCKACVPTLGLGAQLGVAIELDFGFCRKDDFIFVPLNRAFVPDPMLSTWSTQHQTIGFHCQSACPGTLQMNCSKLVPAFVETIKFVE